MNNVTITLPIEKINVVLVGLSKLPIEAALDTFTEVRRQVEEQVNRQPAPAPVPEVTAED